MKTPGGWATGEELPRSSCFSGQCEVAAGKEEKSQVISFIPLSIS